MDIHRALHLDAIIVFFVARRRAIDAACAQSDCRSKIDPALACGVSAPGL
jgi:hypothetical protein